jgi:hypothetical protein
MLIFAGSASAEGLTVADAIGIIEATAASSGSCRVDIMVHGTDGLQSEDCKRFRKLMVKASEAATALGGKDTKLTSEQNYILGNSIRETEENMAFIRATLDASQ